MKKKYTIIAISLVIVTLLIVCGNIFAIENVNVVFENFTEKTNKYEILSVAGVDKGTIIFNLREKDVKQNVAKHYSDNSIVVTNIIREFPNQITIYIKERVPIYKINVLSHTNNSFVATDKDFQMGNILNDYDGILIEVKNLVVKDTFDLEQCRHLRELSERFIAEGINEEALPYLLETITFQNESLVLKLRNSSATFNVLRSDIASISKIYKKYLDLDDSSRLDCNLSNT